MKRILIAAFLFLLGHVSMAQYNEQKLTSILAGSSSKTWIVKGSPKSYSFNVNKSVEMKSDKTESAKWSLSSADNIRWFITIGNQKLELIVSYDKSGKQYIKLTSQPTDKSPAYNEVILYPK